MGKIYCALELNPAREVVSGSRESLRDAIRRGADLRIYTEVRHNEHIDITSDDNQLIKEVSDFPATYLVEDRWVSAMMTLRQPVTLPDRFGDRASMSFFLYNEDGNQAIARPYLDGKGYVPTPDNGPGCVEEKYHFYGSYDQETAAPSTNFIYDFYSYQFLVRDDWEEIYAHDENGTPISGSARALEEASSAGRELKVAISGICNGLWGEEQQRPHELFIQTGPHYFYTEAGYMVAETRPLVRAKPDIPMQYASHNWDFGWCVVRSDGHVAGLFYDPYTLKDRRTFSRHAMRWFAK